MKNYTVAIILLLTFLFQNCHKSKKDDTLLNLLILGYLFNAANACKLEEGDGDPLFADQWHWSNNGSLPSSLSGEDAKVQSVWSQGIKGSGIRIAVVDDGVDIGHEDLRISSVPGIDINFQVSDASHSFANSGHGTSVSGVASARDQNAMGGRGGAPCAEVIGVNLLEKSSFTGADEAQSQTHANTESHISNNSWGPPDDFGLLWAASSSWKSAVENSFNTGRNGLGKVVTWAAGNGGAPGGVTSSLKTDNANYDGYANNPHVLAVCAVGTNGKKAAYSESGANLWVCGHSQGNNTTTYTTAITTTDAMGRFGFNTGSLSTDLSNANYTKNFNGTSSATPLVSGVVALLLNKYPNLTVRDVREILAKSARKNDPTDTDWLVNGAGYNINHKYGFGTVDAASALSVASSWSNISGSWKKFEVSVAGPGASILDNNPTGVTANIIVSGSGISKIEYVEFTTGTAHTYFPDLTIELTSPAGSGSTKSILAEKHTCFTNLSTPTTCPTLGTRISNMTGSSTFTLGSSRHLGESADGTWVVKFIDGAAGDTGTIGSMKLTIYGR
ncbi:MAG: S8 family serine peptidase [Leptospira sp.]|nr:S8 family serine peptidase [Leptospira sp.]NCS94720.1 S8 family serine peptidase [Leptospira sp.]